MAASGRHGGGCDRTLSTHGLPKTWSKEPELEAGWGLKLPNPVMCFLQQVHSTETLLTEPPTRNQVFKFPSLWMNFISHSKLYNLWTFWILQTWVWAHPTCGCLTYKPLSLTKVMSFSDWHTMWRAKQARMGNVTVDRLPFPCSSLYQRTPECWILS